MPRSPLVSIITPCYNAAQHLAATIQSVQSQSMTDWEMIIADDCSTDESLSMARRMSGSDPRIRVAARESNSGLPAVTRNLALSLAEGKYVAFLDADDLWLPEKLEMQLRAMKAGRKSWSFANVEIFGGGAAMPDGLNYPATWQPRGRFHRELLSGEGIPCLTLMVTRRLLAHVSPGGDVARAFDEDPALKAVEDWDLALRLARVTEPLYISRPLARYRAHPGGISKRPGANYRARLALIAKQRRLGAPEQLCARARALQLSKYSAERMLAGCPGWRADLFASALHPPLSARGAYLASLALLPAAVARKAYAVGLGFKRRR